MSLAELLSMMRLLSAIESVLLMSEKLMPDHLYDQIDSHVELLEREITKGMPPCPKS